MLPEGLTAVGAFCVVAGFGAACPRDCAVPLPLGRICARGTTATSMASQSDTVRDGERREASSDDEGSCVQVQQLGGGQVSVCGRQHSLGDTGHLDFGGANLGPAQMAEIATFLASAEAAAVRRLTLSGNTGMTGGGGDLSGLRALCKVLPNLKTPLSLDLAHCGIGVAELNELARAIRGGAVVARLILDENPLTGGDYEWHFDKDLSGVTRVNTCKKYLANRQYLLFFS